MITREVVFNEVSRLLHGRLYIDIPCKQAITDYIMRLLALERTSAAQRLVVSLPPEISKAEFEEAKETLRKIFAGGLTWASWPPLTAEQEADCLIDVEAYIRDSVCKQHCNMEGLDGDTTVCGHPRSSAVSADEGTSHCGECERRALETLDLTRLV